MMELRKIEEVTFFMMKYNFNFFLIFLTSILNTQLSYSNNDLVLYPQLSNSSLQKFYHPTTPFLQYPGKYYWSYLFKIISLIK